MRHGLAIAVAIGLGMGAGRADAGTVTVDWVGKILDLGAIAQYLVEYSLDESVISGSFSYDTRAPVSLSDTYFTRYETDHLSTVSIRLKDPELLGAISQPRSAIQVIDGTRHDPDQIDSRLPASPRNYARDVVDETVSNGFLFDLVVGVVPSVFVRLSDSTGTALDDSTLPARIDPAAFDNDAISTIRFLAFDNARDAYVVVPDLDPVRFQVTHFTATTMGVVPLPGALPLMLTALGGLAFAARRRMR